jgi:hypothetical protein
MPQRSGRGQGRICGIYTMGIRDPYARANTEEQTQKRDQPLLTASIGEDYADCQWPITIKAQAKVTREQLGWYLTKLFEAVDEGFFMDPAIGPAIYWRWSGKSIPGMGPGEGDEDTADSPGIDFEQGSGIATRSEPGKGPLCGIYLVDDAERWSGDHFYGKIQGNAAISGAVGEDYAASRWPLVVKVRAGIHRERFCEYLAALIAAIEAGLFFDVHQAQAAS